MKAPKGLAGEDGSDLKGNKVLKLNKSMHGLVQAARQWYKKFEEVLKDIGFKHNQIDP